MFKKITKGRKELSVELCKYSFYNGKKLLILCFTSTENRIIINILSTIIPVENITNPPVILSHKII
jgi:hypothetical protein